MNGESLEFVSRVLGFERVQWVFLSTLKREDNDLVGLLKVYVLDQRDKCCGVIVVLYLQKRPF